MITLVTGVGYTGRRIVDMLPKESVVGLSRSPGRCDRRVLLMDLDAADELPLDLPAEHNVIYTVPPAGNPPDRRLRHFLPRIEPRRFVYISTTGVYGNRDGELVDEDIQLETMRELMSQ